MTALILRRLALSLRTTVRGCPGSRSWVLRVVALAILIVLGDFLFLWLGARPSEAAIADAVYAPAGVILGALTGGSIVLLVESTRDHTGGAARALETLPLTRSQLVVLENAPTTVLTLGLAVLAIPPIAGVVAAGAAGPGLSSAIALGASSVALGLASTSALVALVAVLMPGPRWSAVRLPVTMLGAVALLVWGIWRTVDGRSHDGSRALDAFLVLPDLIRSAALAGSPAVGVVLACTGAALIAVTVLVPVAVGRGRGARTAVVRIGWRGRGFVAHAQADLLFALRSPVFAANAISAVLVAAAATGFVVSLDARIREALLPLLVIVVCALAASVVRLQRGLLPATRTPQQLLGFTVGAFVAAQLIASVVLFAALLSPLALLAIDPPAEGARFAIELAIAATASLALALASSWLVPIPAESGAAQACASFVTSVVTVGLVAALLQLDEHLTVARMLGVIALLALAAASATLSEARRWRTTRIPDSTRAGPARIETP